MENDFEPVEPAEAPTLPSGVPATASAAAAPGWYVDPWDAGYHRYWSGRDWTTQTFPHGPGGAPAGVRTGSGQFPLPPSGGDDTVHPPPPGWGTVASTPGAGTVPSPPPAPPLASATGAGGMHGRALAAVALVIGLIVGFVLAFAAGTATRRSHASPSSAAASAPPGTAPPLTRPSPRSPTTTPPVEDPAASALAGLVVRQADVSADITVQPLPGGNRVAGEVTLDLCGQSFPSEALRTARLQVVAVDGQGDNPLSTEAVLYRNAGDSAQALAELRATAAACPATPVTTPSGDSTTTHINAAPDGAWPATPTVDRLAFDFTTTDQLNSAQHWVAVYLRRGRVLEGLYFSAPDKPQPAVVGQVTIPSIVSVFASRIALLPATVVNG